MNNQHAGLSQILAEQRMTERLEQAAHARLVGGARPSRRRRRWPARGWWQLARWPAVATEQPVHRPPQRQLNRSEATMSKRTRALVLGVMLAAINLTGLTAVASAQSKDEATSNQDARRPPTQAQVGETWRQSQLPAQAPTVAGDPRRPPTESQVGESWRHPVSALVRPAEPSGPSGWLLASLGGLAAALALIAGLAVLATRRAGRQARLGHVA